ncbi:hypothetical protein FHG64_06095 [Antarcticibacterium flavum]|uniref:TonB-dependent receptor n=1 Tax=Antarcticibacterium flavum TaxID=2058175 RepID=A0A5B7X2W6_9FLAO|nr:MULTISPECIES: hypothetical protein [Antarcticibacterium]MCM4160970.1 hypothetical protein [Antarcticibacterium sp. W02-3]QCY69011.1 hypothetical protein FHG64_06095 [Antarcticibacterium flavum]
MTEIKRSIKFFLLLFSSVVMAQTNLSPAQAGGVAQIPQEQVFVHYNNSLLFAGEYIYYKIYTLDAGSNNLSSLSKVAYVELLGEDGNRVFRHKLKLENGTGRGDFFIPTAVPSGNYKLLGYTQWMLNGGEENIFRSDIAILNPYRGDQSAVTPTEDSGVKLSLRISAEGAQQAPTASGDLSLHITKQKYSPREQVLLKLSGKGSAAEGNYSVSVRKAENIGQPKMPGALDFGKLFHQADRGNPTEVYLPELRGELLQGKIVPVGDEGSSAVQNNKIILSIPGDDYVVKVARTNASGDFFFNVDGEYSGETAFLELLGDQNSQYQIRLAETPAVDPNKLKFNRFYITPQMEEMIVQRSVYNQIENAYYGVKPDTLLTGESRKPFYEKKTIEYDLDDYTRFLTLRETFIEIVKEAYVRNVNGRPNVMVRPYLNATASGMPPLILVDGVVVQDHTTFLDIPAPEVQSIKIVKDNYYLGPQLFQGVLDVRTINGNFHERLTGQHITLLELEKPQPAKRYFKQQYDGDSNENIPDFRYQLLWQPGVNFENNAATLEFFTSDVKGDFEIHVEGFTGDGKPVSLRGEIRVE